MKSFAFVTAAAAVLFQGALAHDHSSATFLGTLPGDNKPPSSSITNLGTLPGLIVSTLPTPAPTSFPGHKVPRQAVTTFSTAVTTCATPTVTITTRRNIQCLIACEKPTSTCSAGEPTGPPQPTATLIASCTETLITGGLCGQCATCVAAPTA